MQVSNLFRRNWWAIFYFNFKMLPFKQAIKFPFDFYGSVRFIQTSGRFIFHTPIRRGLVRFGLTEHTCFPKEQIIIDIAGVWNIKGEFSCGVGTLLEIGKEATLNTGDDVMLSPRTKVIIRKGLSFGSRVSVSWECQIFDSDFHYVENIQTKEIKDMNAPVIIGDHVWIGNRSTIGKGTVIPSSSIVASNSLCNKDYSIGDSKTNLIIAGIPAKVINSGFKRIFEIEEPELINSLRSKYDE